jgi:rRNA maturation endonuclease Nob1
MRRAVVLDSTPIIVGSVSGETGTEVFAPPGVIEEVLNTTSEFQRTKVEALLSSGAIKVRNPQRSSVERVSRSLNREERERASRADVEVLALSLELTEEGYSVLLISDDSLVQRAAARLGITCKGVKYTHRSGV